MSLTPRLDKLQKNYIINGDMRVAQRGTSFAAIANGSFSLDRYRYGKNGAMVHTISQDTDVPTLAQSGYLFQNSLRLNLTTPDTSIAASDRCFIQQAIEGYNWAKIAQKDFTISFWVKATLTGTYSLSLQNSGADRYYITEYTINASNTWEKKTVTIPASVTTGTWNYSNGVGLYVQWMLAGGTDVHGSLNTWGTGNLYSSPNQVNGVNTGATDFKITGIMVLEGEHDDPEFTTFAKDFEEELHACRRYFQKTYAITVAPGTATLNGAFSGAADANGVSHHFGTKWYTPEMRVTPSIAAYRVSGGAPSATPFTDADGVSNPFGISIYDNSPRGFSAHVNGASGAGATKYCHLTFDAEL